MTSIYNGRFQGNILVVGGTNCGKTTFIEKLGLNNFFENIVRTEWISGIEIDKKEKLKFNHILKMGQKFILHQNKINLTL